MSEDLNLLRHMQVKVRKHDTEMAAIAQELLQKMGIINSNHIFADNTARDTYFTAHPTELVANVLISVGTGFQEYNGSTWVAKTGIVQDTTLTADYLTVVGINLYNQTAVAPENGYVYSTSTGARSASASFANTGKIPVSANASYCFGVGGKGMIHSAVFFNGASFISANSALTQSNLGVKFITPANCTHAVFNLFAVAHTTDEYTAAMAVAQLETSTSATLYQAYSSEKLFDLSNLEQHKAFDSLKVSFIDASGKNLYNKALAIDGKYLDTSGVVSASANSAFTGFIPVKPNTQYCLSVDMVQLERFTGVIYEYDINGAYVKKTTYTRTGVTQFFTGATTYFVGANFLMKAHTPEEFTAVINTIQFEYNATRTTFEAYGFKTKIDESYISNSNYKTRLSRLESKKWLSLGTSLTEYNGNVYQSGSEGICQGYQSHVVKNTGMLLQNDGISGSTLTNVNANSLINRYTGYTYTNYDFVTIEYGGINDFGNNAALGVIGDAANATTYIGCLKTVIEYILTNSPTTKIILITTPDVNQTANSVLLYLKDYVDAMKAVAALYRLKVCDLFYLSGINSYTKASLTIDGTHPNNAGNERMGYQLLKEFEVS